MRTRSLQQQPAKNTTPPSARGFFGRHVSLRLKLPIMVIFLLLLALAISTYLSIQEARTALIDTLKNELDRKSVV